MFFTCTCGFLDFVVDAVDYFLMLGSLSALIWVGGGIRFCLAFTVELVG